MSHSTVLIIGEDPEKMLEPYDENTEVEPYRDYEKAERPQDHWLFDTLVKEGLPNDADWQMLLEAYNTRYGDEGKLVYDSDKDRVYSMSTYNPQSKWDWYQLGGRWTGFFKLKPGSQGETGSPGLMTAPGKPGWADQTRKQDIDFEGMRDVAGAEAVEFHAQITGILAKHPPMVSWKHVRDVLFPGDIAAAREWYWVQPGNQALLNAKHWIDDPVEYLCLGHDNPILEYTTRKRLEACLTFAILDKDGWHERGNMGWFGMVTNENDAWPEAAQAIMDDAPEDSLFSVYDVHI